MQKTNKIYFQEDQVLYIIYFIFFLFTHISCRDEGPTFLSLDTAHLIKSGSNLIRNEEKCIYFLVR